MRIAILNALPLNAFSSMNDFKLRVRRISLAELQNLKGQIVHYIRHPATVELLRRYLPLQEPNAGLYVYQPGDVIVVVTLRQPQRGQEVVELHESDLDVYLIEVA